MRRARSTNIDLRDLPKSHPVKQERPEREEPDLNPVELPGGPVPSGPTLPPGPSAPAPAPISNFDGLDFANWGAGHPPDTNGDVGPTYYIQTINTSIGVYRKSDSVRVAAFTFNTFMSQGQFGNLCDTNNFGDPVVLYDTFEDRWVITDFAFTLDGAGNVINPPGAFQCFAVSKTGDPVTGGWNFYSISIAGGLGDYPKFGIWPDGIYMSANIFGYPAGAAFQGPRVFALNKAQMYAGNPTVQVVSFNAPVADFTLLPSNARLQTGTPPAGTPNYFVSTWEFTNALTVYKFHADWNRLSASTFTGPDVPLAATSWPNAAVANAPSLGGNLLDVLQIRAMMQSQYTNLAGVESLWTTHTVRRANTAGFAASRWYQANVTGGTVAANLPQAATWDPDGANVLHRFVPSLAVDRAGDMALGYTTSSSTTKPAIAYAGRLAADPINTFSQTEQVLIQGTGTQLGNCGTTSCIRWGDYSAMTLDPDGCTFWYTAEYYSVDGLNHQTRIGSFAYPSCTPVGAGGTVSGTVTASPGGTPLNGATVALGSRTTTTDVTGFYSFASIPAGTYPTISASYPGCSTSTVTGIVVNDGATTTQNFALNAAPTSACVTDTTQQDFQQGIQNNVDLATSPGDIILSKPSLDQLNETIGGSGVGITVTTWGGQTFTPAVSGLLTKADINLFCSGCTGTTPNLTLSVRATSGGLPTGADLASATIPGFGNGGVASYFTVTFGTPPSLTAGTMYALVIRPTANPSPGTYALTRSGTSTAGANVYAGGTRVAGATSGTVWSIPLTGGVSTDAGFHTFMDSGYLPAGDQISELVDANPAPGFTTAWAPLSWNAATPANTGVKFQAAASNAAIGPFNFVGPDGTAATFFTTSGASLSQFDGSRYLKYRAFLTTTDSAATPTLNDVTVCFTDPCIPPPTPMVTPGGPTTFCAGGSVTLTSSSATGNQWSLTGNPISGATLQQYVATASGDYTVVVTNAANSCPSAPSAVTTVTVNPLPATPTITPSGPTTFFDGGSVTLISSSATGNQWYLDGNPIGGATSQQYVATVGGNYTVVVTTGPCSSSPSAVTTVTVNPLSDLSITNTDGVTTIMPGATTTFTITASNAGPTNAPGTTVTDTFPAALTCNWTCVGSGGTCTASGSGSINDSITLSSGGSVTYTAVCTVSAAATGTLSNTASVTAPGGTTDPTLSNNTATDNDAIVAQADVALTMDDNRSVVEISRSVTYVIDVKNPTGPNAVTATVTDALPSGLIDGNWVCIPFGAATCANGFGNTLTDTVSLPIGSEVAYVYSATVYTGDANDLLTNTASVSVNGTDPVPANNSATDTDLVVIFDDGFDGTPLMVPNNVGNGTNYVTASLRVDTGLLNSLTIMPTAVASGIGADGKTLFTLELARFGKDIVLRVSTTDAMGLSQRSEWQIIDLSQHLLSFSWQSASTGLTDGYLKVAGAGTPLVVLSGSGEKDRLTQLVVTVENTVPWLILITH